MYFFFFLFQVLCVIDIEDIAMSVWLVSSHMCAVNWCDNYSYFKVHYELWNHEHLQYYGNWSWFVKRFLLCTTGDLFNSLGLSDAIWQQRSGSTLAQVMACCLMAPSHYLNQCWLIISEVQWHSYQGNLTRMSQSSITKICLKITCLKFHSNFSGVNELTNQK